MRCSADWARLTRKREVSVKRGSLVTVFTVDLWLLAVSRDLSFGNVSTRLFSRSDCGLIRYASFSSTQSYPDAKPKESRVGRIRKQTVEFAGRLKQRGLTVLPTKDLRRKFVAVLAFPASKGHSADRVLV